MPRIPLSVRRARARKRAGLPPYERSEDDLELVEFEIVEPEPSDGDDPDKTPKAPDPLGSETDDE